MYVALVAAAVATSSQIAPPSPAPVVFAPGEISAGPSVDSPAFTPDGQTVFFDRSTGPVSTIMVSHRRRGHWTKPVVAPFSGTWSDKDPAMAPDGSFIVFSSNRPADGRGAALDLSLADGRVIKARGGQLWRVDRRGGGWDAPARLPEIINAGTRVFSPSIVAGGLYFQRYDPQTGATHIFRSAYRDGRYQPPARVRLGPDAAEERDATVAPDESFLVFSANYGPKGAASRFHIAFREGSVWSAPIDLSEAVKVKGAEGPHLGPDGRSIFFDADAPGNPDESVIWKLDLKRWLAARAPGAPVASGPATLFAPERVWPAGTDVAPAFTPDGQTVFFTHAKGTRRTIMVSHRGPEGWSAPEPASFSGRWRDIEPAMAPDGSYLVFISNRPTSPSGAMLTGYWGGAPRPGAGGNIWRVDRTAIGWGEPRRLPVTVNSNAAIYSPAVAGDGSLYFNQPDPITHKSRVYRAQARGEGFDPAVVMSFSSGPGTAYDVTVAPDESFVVFSSGRSPARAGQSLLFVASRTADGWSEPQVLGGGIEGLEARLSPDLKTLYFTAWDDGDGGPGRIHQVELSRSSGPG